jgi:molecular chaperone GrpE
MQDDAAPSSPKVDDTEDTYELDLGPEEESGVDDLMEAAVEAVEKKRRRRSEPDSDEATPSAGDGNVVDIAAGDGGASDGGANDAVVAKLKDHLARTMADFDNFRKRTEREKKDLERHAAGKVVKDMLPVIDNLDRALQAGGSVDELKKGLEMVMRQQADVLRRLGVVPVKAVGEPFDPAVHEAVAREESSGVDVPTVSAELQKGYTIHDRLLRPAMVYVTMPVAKPKHAEANDTHEGETDPASEPTTAAAGEEDGDRIDADSGAGAPEETGASTRQAR